MKRRIRLLHTIHLFTLVLTLGFCPVASAQSFGSASSAHSPHEGEAVLAMERDLALVLTRDGFDAFATLFHDDFTLWIDGRETTRAEYLPPVAAWRAAGNGAISTQMRPVSIDVFGDLALSRYVLRENFVDGTSFVGRFVSLARRDNGCWQVYRSTVFTLYRGPSEGAPTLEAPEPGDPSGVERAVSHCTNSQMLDHPNEHNE